MKCILLCYFFYVTTYEVHPLMLRLLISAFVYRRDPPYYILDVNYSCVSMYRYVLETKCYHYNKMDKK